MLIGDVDFDLGRAVFVGGFGFAVVALVVVWVRDSLMGKTKDSPAEVPEVMVDAQPITGFYESMGRDTNLPEPNFDVFGPPIGGIPSEQILSPAYNFLPYNIHHDTSNDG